MSCLGYQFTSPDTMCQSVLNINIPRAYHITTQGMKYNCNVYTGYERMSFFNWQMARISCCHTSNNSHWPGGRLMLAQRRKRWTTLNQHWVSASCLLGKDVILKVIVLTLWPLISTIVTFNPLTAKFFNFNFHPLEVVSRWRDPQLQLSENYSDLTKWR